MATEISFTGTIPAEFLAAVRRFHADMAELRQNPDFLAAVQTARERSGRLLLALDDHGGYAIEVAIGAPPIEDDGCHRIELTVQPATALSA